MLEEFYRELDEEDQLFLGNRFVGEENDTDTDYESDNNEADIAAEDLEEEPTIDSNVEDLEVEPVEAVTEQGNDELPTKQKFKNLTEVLNEANYSDVPAQKKNVPSTIVMPRKLKILHGRRPKTTLFIERGLKTFVKVKQTPEVSPRMLKRLWNR